MSDATKGRPLKWLLAAAWMVIMAMGVPEGHAAAIAGSDAQTVASRSQDLNQATRAEIESVRGIGVDLAGRILQAREHQPFTDWADVRQRVKGLSRHARQGLIEAGFTVKGRTLNLSEPFHENIRR